MGDERASQSKMTARQIKTFYFALAAVNTLATTWFLNYLFFFLHDRFGFDNRQNLWVSALYGLVYMLAAWQCGSSRNAGVLSPA